MKKFTIDFMINTADACYSEKRLNRLWGSKKSLTVGEILSLKIPYYDKFWFISVFSSRNFLDKKTEKKINRVLIETLLNETEKIYPGEKIRIDRLRVNAKDGFYSKKCFEDFDWFSFLVRTTNLYFEKNLRFVLLGTFFIDIDKYHDMYLTPLLAEVFSAFYNDKKNLFNKIIKELNK